MKAQPVKPREIERDRAKFLEELERLSQYHSVGWGGGRPLVFETHQVWWRNGGERQNLHFVSSYIFWPEFSSETFWSFVCRSIDMRRRGFALVQPPAVKYHRTVLTPKQEKKRKEKQEGSYPLYIVDRSRRFRYIWSGDATRRFRMAGSFISSLTPWWTTLSTPTPQYNNKETAQQLALFTL